MGKQVAFCSKKEQFQTVGLFEKPLFFRREYFLPHPIWEYGTEKICLEFTCLPVYTNKQVDEILGEIFTLVHIRQTQSIINESAKTDI
jgi:hypothetical protein